MPHNNRRFLFLNIGHFIDHFLVLIFATVAALALNREWGMSYAQLIPYATPGVVAFGLFSVPAGWLADKWRRESMMTIFFIGIGICSMLTATADSPLMMGFWLTATGIFAAIYHPVGLAMVVEARQRMGMALAVNGVFGNMGVACAALVTGLLIDHGGWRSAFVIPGACAVICGIAWQLLEGRAPSASTGKGQAGETLALPRDLLVRVFTVIFVTTAFSGVVFQSTTFALPKILDERLADMAGSATLIGFYTFLVFAAAAFAQIVVGHLIDRHPIRNVFAWITALQAVLFVAMISLTGVPALLVALGFMLAVFGQIPIKDTLIGRMARSEWRSRAYSVSYIINFSVSAAAVPMIALVHAHRGFDTLFGILAVFALVTLVGALLLPRRGLDRSLAQPA